VVRSVPRQGNHRFHPKYINIIRKYRIFFAYLTQKIEYANTIAYYIMNTLPKDMLELICLRLTMQDISNLLESGKEIASILDVQIEKSYRFCASILVRTRKIYDVIEHRTELRWGYSHPTAESLQKIYAINKCNNSQVEDFGVIFFDIFRVRGGTYTPISIAVYMDKYQRAKVILECLPARMYNTCITSTYVTKKMMDIFYLIDIYYYINCNVSSICDHELTRRLIDFINLRPRMPWRAMCRDKEIIDFIRFI
jgi:hypothetical protein